MTLMISKLNSQFRGLLLIFMKFLLQIRSSRSLLAILAASILGIGSIVYLMYLPEEAIARHSAIILAAAGGVYVGFGLSNDDLNSSILETLSALFFGVLAIMGVTFSLVLGIGFLLHAVWDYLHQRCSARRTVKPHRDVF